MPITDDTWSREDIFPDAERFALDAALDKGNALARSVQLGHSPFLDYHDIENEIAFKKCCMASQTIMVHAQLGYRDLDKTCQAYGKIHDVVSARGGRIDRYGICLDWSMGYPPDQRRNCAKGTGLILDEPQDYQRLTAMAPVAPHFGDFVLGMPAALENTACALAAGSTTIGNIGQYFTFRLPGWDDDLATTEATVSALALCARQPVDILIHSNLDDGFAALFADLSCSLGAVLLEHHIVSDLLGCPIGHCFGHTFSDPVTRWAFQRALARIQHAPGTMIYGNTTAYGPESASNYAALACYLGIDITALRYEPTGHAINPVPVSEALRIPDIDEIIDASLFAATLIRNTEPISPLISPQQTEPIVEALLGGAQTFYENVMAAFDKRDIDTGNALEMLLGLKRIGARTLETLYGPGKADDTAPNKRRALIQTPVIDELETAAREIIRNLGDKIQAFSSAELSICVATSDVHEYGKLVLDNVLGELGINIIDGGISTDPDTLAELAINSGAQAIALSTYNGIALDFLSDLKDHLGTRNSKLPIYIGGKLNQVPNDSNSSLPIDVHAKIKAHGAIPCDTIESMIQHLYSTIQ